MTTDAPIKGMWVVSSDDQLTPEIMEHAKVVLEQAAENGQQVVVVEGIELRWRPTPIDTSRLADYEAAVDALAEVARVLVPDPKGAPGHRGRAWAHVDHAYAIAEAALRRLRGDR